MASPAGVRRLPVRARQQRRADPVLQPAQLAQQRRGASRGLAAPRWV
jgi:hypothetical protein